jgi:hypothetical protein
MIRQTSSIERMSYASLIFIVLVFFGGLIYFFAPIELGLRHLFFGLVVIVTFGVAIIAYTHSKSTKPRIPPKPSSPPKISATPQPDVQAVPEKVELIHEVTSSDPPPKRRGRRRETFNELVTENGVKWLIIHTYTPIPQGAFKKKLWRHKTQRLELDNSRYVNARLATKLPLLPSNDEAKIYCLLRLHWWSHGPAQISVTAATLVSIALVAIIGMNTPDPNAYTGTLIVILLLAVAGSIWYYIVWMQWGYRYLVFTNLKIRLLYLPPFNLPSETPETELALLEGGLNPSSSFWGRMWGYGTIKTETVARTVDNWLVNKVNFVPYYRQVAALLSQLREDAIRQLNS